MTQRSENNLTEIMERLAQRVYAQIDEQKPEWADLSPVGKQGFKNNLLPIMMDVLNVADEVDAFGPPLYRWANEAETEAWGAGTFIRGAVQVITGDDHGDPLTDIAIPIEFRLEQA